MSDLALHHFSLDGDREHFQCACHQPHHFLCVDTYIDPRHWNHSYVFVHLGLDSGLAWRERWRLAGAILSGRWAHDVRVVELGVKSLKRLHGHLGAILGEIEQQRQNARQHPWSFQKLLSGKRQFELFLEAHRKEQEWSVREWLSYLAHLNRGLVSALNESNTTQREAKLERHLGSQVYGQLARTDLAIFELLILTQELHLAALDEYRETTQKDLSQGSSDRGPAREISVESGVIP